MPTRSQSSSTLRGGDEPSSHFLAQSVLLMIWCLGVLGSALLKGTTITPDFGESYWTRPGNLNFEFFTTLAILTFGFLWAWRFTRKHPGRWSGMLTALCVATIVIIAPRVARSILFSVHSRQIAQVFDTYGKHWGRPATWALWIFGYIASFVMLTAIPFLLLIRRRRQRLQPES